MPFLPNRIVQILASLFVGLSQGASGLVASEGPFVTLVEDTQRIAVYDAGELVLAYNKTAPDLPHGIDAVYRRSGFLHPVCSVAGQVVTAAYPEDHPHQNGIFAAWVKTKFQGREVDFWNLAKRSGGVRHHRVIWTECNASGARFQVELRHAVVGPHPIDVVREIWTVSYDSAPQSVRVFDIESVQEPIDGPLQIQEYHYGGMAVRGPAAWLLELESSSRCEMINDLGSKRVLGNHERAHWVALSAQPGGNPVSIAMLSHKENFRSPQPARLHPQMPYFCFAPCVAGEFQLTRDQPLRSRYRFVVTDERPDSAFLDRVWMNWCERTLQSK